MLLVAAELMPRVAPTTIFLLLFFFFSGCLAFPAEPLLRSHAHNKRLHLRGWGARGLRGKGVLCVGDNVKSDNSHFLSAERCLKFGCILCRDKSAVFLLTD